MSGSHLSEVISGISVRMGFLLQLGSIPIAVSSNLPHSHSLSLANAFRFEAVPSSTTIVWSPPFSQFLIVGDVSAFTTAYGGPAPSVVVRHYLICLQVVSLLRLRFVDVHLRRRFLIPEILGWSAILSWTSFFNVHTL